MLRRDPLATAPPALGSLAGAIVNKTATMHRRDPLAALNQLWPQDTSWNAWQADPMNQLRNKGKPTSEKTSLWRQAKARLDDGDQDDGEAEAKKKGERKKRAHPKKKKKEDSNEDDEDENDGEGDDDSSAAEVRLSVAEAPVRRRGAFPAPI